MKDDYKFWLEEIDSALWYKKDDAFDEQLRNEFLDLHAQAVKGELEDWKETARGCMSFIVLIDQFSRNMFRGTPESFKYDPVALAASKEGIERNLDKELDIVKGREFFYLPLMHSENLGDQELCLEIFEDLAQEGEYFAGNAKYAKMHLDIVERFGRFPHRNAVLGRESTPEELEFLTQDGSSF